MDKFHISYYVKKQKKSKILYKIQVALPLFDVIEELSNLSKATNVEKLQQQIINYRLENLRQNGEFKTSMTTWFNKPPADLIWSNVKKYITNAHIKLIKVQGASLVHTPYKQTNNAIKVLTHEFVEMCSEVLGSVNALTTSHKEILTSLTQSPPLMESTQVSSISNSDAVPQFNYIEVYRLKKLG